MCFVYWWIMYCFSLCFFCKNFSGWLKHLLLTNNSDSIRFISSISETVWIISLLVHIVFRGASSFFFIVAQQRLWYNTSFAKAFPGHTVEFNCQYLPLIVFARLLAFSDQFLSSRLYEAVYLFFDILYTGFSSFSSVKFVNEGLPHLGLLAGGVARLIALLSFFFGSFRCFFVCNILVALAMMKFIVINNIL